MLDTSIKAKEPVDEDVFYADKTIENVQVEIALQYVNTYQRR